MTENFVQKTLDKLLEVVEVEFKIPLGFAEIKFPVTAHAKKWWKNKKSKLEVEKAIQRAEENFIAAHPSQKVAQMLHELPLYSEEEFKQVIAGLLTHLSEEKITWLAEVKLKKTWGNVANIEEIRKALELYLPLLRHELNGIEEFRDIINARAIERIDSGVRRIESKLDKVLESRESNKSKSEPDFWFIPHPYPMPPNFTGRADEQKMLDDWLADNTNRLIILRALGGFGKSALAWQWINTHVDPAKWTKLVSWSFYEGDASFENFIEGTLKYLKLEVPQGQRPQVDELLKAMQSQKILLIMDGFERVLRLYASMNAAYQSDEEQQIEENQLDCKNVHAEWFLRCVCSFPNIRSKILMTTRHTPNAVKPSGEFLLGCREEELTAMQKADAVEYFYKRGVQGNRAEIEKVGASYGYHPLSLKILTGLIINDRETPGDIAVADNLDITDDIIQNKHHVLEVAYNTLAPEQQKLLSSIASFRFPIEYATLKIISGIPSRKRKKNKSSSIENLGSRLKTLETHGLLQWDRKANKYDLHPIVRRYAYERLTLPERTRVHKGLANYFEAVPKPEKAEKLEDLALVIELYHHTVRAGKLDEAIVLFRDRLNQATYFQFGSYQLIIELMLALFLDGEDKLPLLKKESTQGWVQNGLANSYALSGQPHQALPLYEGYIFISETRNDQKNTAIGLGNIANMAQLPIGALRAAERNQRRSIDLCSEIEDEFSKGVGHQVLGRVLSYRGIWPEAEQELNRGLQLFEKHNEVQSQCVIWSYRALHFLLMAREKVISNQSPVDSINSVIECARRALELADETARDSRFVYPIRDYIRAYWLLGSSWRAKGDLFQAEENLSKAISMCRQINMVDIEANILLDLARLRYDQQKTEEAKSLAEEALSITQRCGYVLQGADVNLFLAQYALEQEQDKAKAKAYAEEARKLATCDGPPYYYKVAYEEAERFLEKLK